MMNDISLSSGACSVVLNAIVEPNSSITVESISSTGAPSATPKCHAIRPSSTRTRAVTSFSTNLIAYVDSRYSYNESKAKPSSCSLGNRAAAT